MKNVYAFIIVLLALILMNIVGRHIQNAVSNIPHEVFVGVYDDIGLFDESKDMKFHLTYYGWVNALEDLTSDLEKIKKLNRIPILTIEPWPYRDYEGDANMFLHEIKLGAYDSVIDGICSEVSKYGDKAYIRWGHEMELPNLRYAWSNKNTARYIDAYRHFVDRCKLNTSNALYMWSPSGEWNAENYWPGEDYVDVIGLSLYSFKEWDEKNIGYQRSFKELMDGKYSHVGKYNKPIIISEMGVTGDGEYQYNWLKDARASFSSYPLLYGVVYFNTYRGDDLWDKDLIAPDWRIDSEKLNLLFR